MQLDMGGGKTSVIVPMLVCELATASTLVRPIVGKAQSQQMMHMLISKPGGLIDRHVSYMPFSRRLRNNNAAAQVIHEICQTTMREGGVLVQPEHLLSLKLMIPDSVLLGYNTTGATLARTQDLFDRCARDIVDESDAEFNVSRELIHTVGTQRPVDMSPA